MMTKRHFRLLRLKARRGRQITEMMNETGTTVAAFTQCVQSTNKVTD